MVTSRRTPGVYVREVAAFPPSIVGVQTAVPAFLGYTEKAEQAGIQVGGKPVQINSLAEYEHVFGGMHQERFKIHRLTETNVKNKVPYDLMQITYAPDGDGLDETYKNDPKPAYYTIAPSMKVKPGWPSPTKHVLERAFAVYLSSAAKWSRVPGLPTVTVGKDSFDVEFSLDPTAPAVEPLGPDGEKTANFGNPDPTRPTLVLQVVPPDGGSQGPAGSTTPSAILSGVLVKGLRLEACVIGLPATALETSDGKADASSPFPVFGGVPAVGSYVRIGVKELFRKPISKLSVLLRWFGLPTDDGGFAGWYRDYTIGPDGKRSDKPLFENSTFGGRLTLRNPGPWTFDPESQDAKLFSDASGPTASLAGQTSFQPELGKPPERSADRYDPATGAIQLQLRAPPYGFGKDLYAKNVLAATLDNLADMDTCRVACVAAYAPLRNLGLALKVLVDSAPKSDLEKEVLAAMVRCANELLVQVTVAHRGCPAARGFEDVFTAVAAFVSAPPSLGSASNLRDSLADYAGSLKEQNCEAFADPMSAYAAALEPLMECVLGSGPFPKCLGQVGDVIEKLAADGEQACLKACMKPKLPIRQPNTPVIPFAEGITVDYEACASMKKVAGCATLSMFHLLPFGGSEPVDMQAGTVPLLQPLAPGDRCLDSLYIGLDGAGTAQTLSLLFEMGNEAAAGAEVTWAHAAGTGRWQTIVPALDTTDELTTSGLVRLALPAGVTRLRASVASTSDPTSTTIAVRAHGTTATRRLPGDGGGDASPHLPARSITGLADRVPGVGAVVQPAPSAGGRSAEDPASWGRRLGERLRHKDRASLEWDYERLALESSPRLWQVAVLPADGTAGREPGRVRVVVVPGPQAQGVDDPTAPRASRSELAALTATLGSRGSVFAKIDVANPVYSRVKVTADVAFVSGDGDPVGRLDKELVAYLSPWFFDAAREATGGRYTSPAEIAQFIRSRPYVAALTTLKIHAEPPAQESAWVYRTSAATHEIKPVPIPADGSGECT